MPAIPVYMSVTPKDSHFLIDHTPESHVPVSTAVVEAVSSVAGLPPTDLPPLSGSLDPDALDRLVSSPLDAKIRFSYTGYLVVVHGDATVEVFDDR